MPTGAPRGHPPPIGFQCSLARMVAGWALDLLQIQNQPLRIVADLEGALLGWYASSGDTKWWLRMLPVARWPVSLLHQGSRPRRDLEHAGEWRPGDRDTRTAASSSLSLLERNVCRNLFFRSRNRRYICRAEILPLRQAPRGAGAVTHSPADELRARLGGEPRRPPGAVGTTFAQDQPGFAGKRIPVGACHNRVECRPFPVRKGVPSTQRLPSSFPDLSYVLGKPCEEHGVVRLFPGADHSLPSTLRFPGTGAWSLHRAIIGV
jgi:hypothetical protein